MPKGRSTTSILLVALISISIGGARLAASAPPPNVVASSSMNGRFLVVARMESAANEAQAAVRRIVRTSYEVFEAEPFINSKDRLSTPTRFWSDSAMSWRVALEGGETPWPMVSDDGTYLVLVSVTVGFPGQVVLRIYRKEGREGHLVKDFQLSDLWTTAEVNSRGVVVGPEGKRVFAATDATPEWFAGGSLALAPMANT